MGCGEKKANTVYSYDGLQEGQNPISNVRPGFYPDGVPEPTWVDCIKVDKVYESCFESLVNEEVSNPEIPEGAQILNVTCSSVELVGDVVCEKIPNTNRVRTTFTYQYCYEYTFQVNNDVTTLVYCDTETVSRIAILSDRVQDPRIEVQCEIFLDCLECFPSNETEVTCCILKVIVFKLTAHVQLLIPAYGFCPLPDPCPEVLGECPQVPIPPWPPYPPQDE